MNKSKLQEAEITKGIIFLLLVFVILLLLITDTNTDYKVKFGVGKYSFNLDKTRQNTNRKSNRHYRHGRRAYGKRTSYRNRQNTNLTINDLKNSKENQYLSVRLQDIYNDKTFKEQVDWVKVIEEFEKNFPRERTFDWEKVERRLVGYVDNNIASSKRMSLFLKGLLRIKQDYYSFNLQRQGKIEQKKIQDKKAIPQANEKKTVDTKETEYSVTANKNIHKHSKVNVKKFEVRITRIEEQRLRNLTRNYIPFSKILEDKQFVKLTGMSSIQFSKRMNWKLFDTKLMNFMRNRILNRVSSDSKESIIMSRFEEIEFSYQHYSKYKNLKETVKSLDSIISNKQAKNGKQKNKVNHTVTSTEKTIDKADKCTENCVNICQNYFKKYKDFISCSKKACYCNENDILKLNILSQNNTSGSRIIVYLLFSVTVLICFHVLHSLYKKKTKFSECDSTNKHYELLAYEETNFI